MNHLYVTLEVQEDVEHEVGYYFELGGEERAREFEDKYLAALRQIRDIPNAGRVEKRMPSTYRFIGIGKAFILHYRMNQGHDDMLVYHIHGASQDTKKLSPSGLQRRATEGQKERQLHEGRTDG